PTAPRREPCILIYAADHAEGRNSSWATVGIVERLLSKERGGARVSATRGRYLIIPMLNPVANVWNNGMLSFTPDNPTRESLAFSKFLRDWVDGGGRLDVVVHLLS